MQIYILEYGYDSYYTDTKKNMEDAFSTFEEANKEAISYSEYSRPDIYLYDLDNHKVIKKIEPIFPSNKKKTKISVDDNIHDNDIDIPF